MGLFVVWVILGLAAAAVAAQRGHGLVALISFFVPIAVVLSFAQPRGDAATCPWCRETIRQGAIVCKHCGRDLRAGPQGEAPPPLPTLRRSNLLGAIVFAVVVGAVVALLQIAYPA